MPGLFFLQTLRIPGHVSGNQPNTQAPVVLGQQHPAKFGEPIPRVIKGAEDRLPILDRESDEILIRLESDDECPAVSSNPLNPLWTFRSGLAARIWLSTVCQACQERHAVTNGGTQVAGTQADAELASYLRIEERGLVAGRGKGDRLTARPRLLFVAPSVTGSPRSASRKVCAHRTKWTRSGRAAAVIVAASASDLRGAAVLLG